MHVNMLEELRSYITSLEKETIPQLSVNCVMLAFHERTLKVVVNEFKLGERMFLVLPGGYVKQSEDLEDAVERIVRVSTGLEDILFRQFAVFGKASRSFARELDLTTGLHSGSDQIVLDWLSKRFISVCYIALLDFRTMELQPTEFYHAARWISMDQADRLDMDHSDILNSAREFLMKEMPYTPFASNLLPPHFTLPDLQALMESILNRKIDRANFRRKILGTDTLEKVGITHSGKGRPADSYRFKFGKHTALMDEFKFGF
jgi:ADP-ribose pyrophosphatase YjhB (NUDIX family)